MSSSSSAAATPETNPSKKQKLGQPHNKGGTTLDDDDDEAPPAYGSQEYWDARYAQSNSSNDNQDASAPNAHHAWYFTYPELRALLWPLIFGHDDDEEDANHADTSEKEDSPLQQRREGLVPKGLPISVLEVGCGDVPLINELAEELLKTNARVERLVGCDYSASAIAALQQEQQQKEIRSTSTNNETHVASPQENKVSYVQADARQLPYSDSSVSLILEKGTLDAMLSDKEGPTHCRSILSECARVLCRNGYILLVSHLNAHTDEGMEWLQDIVIPGLLQAAAEDEGGEGVDWNIEVHGSAGEDNDEEGADDDDNGTTETDDVGGSPGPAVYILHKLPLSKHNNDDPKETPKEPSVTLNFFSY